MQKLLPVDITVGALIQMALALVRGGDDAYQAADLERMGTSLTPIEQFMDYKGFLFGCLNTKTPPLEEFLGGALPFIIVADQAPNGMEILGAKAVTSWRRTETSN